MINRSAQAKKEFDNPLRMSDKSNGSKLIGIQHLNTMDTNDKASKNIEGHCCAQNNKFSVKNLL